MWNHFENLVYYVWNAKHYKSLLLMEMIWVNSVGINCAFPAYPKSVPTADLIVSTQMIFQGLGISVIWYDWKSLPGASLRMPLRTFLYFPIGTLFSIVLGCTFKVLWGSRKSNGRIREIVSVCAWNLWFLLCLIFVPGMLSVSIKSNRQLSSTRR